MSNSTLNRCFPIALQTYLQRRGSFIVFFFSVCVAASGCRSIDTKTNELAKQPDAPSQEAIDRIGSLYPEMNLGVSIVSVKDKKPFFSHNERKLFVPASTAKLLTFAAALHYLGPQFRYDTGLYTEKRTGSSLKHLFLKGSGDPSFSSTDISKLIGELKQLGIRRINGDIIIDASIFDEVSYGNGWMVNDLSEGYSAPVSGVNIDHNRVAFGLFPSTRLKEPIQCTAFPQTNYFKIENLASTGNSNSASSVSISIAKGKTSVDNTLTSTGIFKGSSIVIKGKAPASSNVKYETLAIQNPLEFAGILTQEALTRQGIIFKGKIRFATVPESALLLTHHYSAPLSEMIIDFVKMSNNHATESLLKTIAVAQSGAPGTFDKGLLAVTEFLKKKAGVAVAGLVAADGSGLSRYNQISASQLTDLLTYMWNNFEIGPEFITSLAIFGEDGTLRKTGEASLNKNVRAKTGSMRNLRSLAGYMKLDTGEVVAFAVLTNGTDANPQSQKRAIEDILATVRGRVAEGSNN